MGWYALSHMYPYHPTRAYITLNVPALFPMCRHQSHVGYHTGQSIWVHWLGYDHHTMLPNTRTFPLPLPYPLP